MNYKKVIKDLKERNDKLQEQYRLRDIRCIHLEYENEMLKGDFEAQHELTKKYAKENKELKEELEKEYNKGYERGILDTVEENQRLDKENRELKEQVDYLRRSIERKEETIIDLEDERVPYTNEYVEKLKKQLEEWNYHLKCSKEMLDIQGHNGNYNYDSYMLGIYNGMEYIIALFETREPIYRDGKDIEFLSNKNQQKEFIKYLEDLIKQNETVVEVSKYGLPKNCSKLLIDFYKEILSKYKEIIGDKNKKYIPE